MNPALEDIEAIESVDDGDIIRIHMALKNGGHQTIDIDHAKVGNFITGVAYGAREAAKQRPQFTESGNAIPQRVTFPYLEGIETYLHESNVVVRIVLQPGIHVDYRIPQSSAAQLAKDLERLAHQTSDTPPTKH